jgi:hypothetical protein
LGILTYLRLACWMGHLKYPKIFFINEKRKFHFHCCSARKGLFIYVSTYAKKFHICFYFVKFQLFFHISFPFTFVYRKARNLSWSFSSLPWIDIIMFYIYLKNVEFSPLYCFFITSEKVGSNKISINTYLHLLIYE